ncbi:hypothetical protein QRD02_05580 [Aequorivita sp. SDUM287046]|uniref:Thioredoxin domain-containing protein n=1 Tax=Aequorivita aurantiaca TaxID=3053356 RepID=A0ABT8DIM1_9FLAO|nr:thioredoxin-like domain-containing protein [Aequorivita aurantiaca]MDN3723844.1 hypothetical protein [Aequorivita aurantiaca]
MKTTYIAGQIINPRVDYIVFSKGNQTLDTVKLDRNNFFHYQTDKIKAGLYFLKHGESQIFFIEPGDSLLIHLNTIDFDESLAYSGRGGEQNNLLIDLYLRNENENLNLQKWYTLSSSEFEHKIDSLKKRKINLYEEYINTNEVAEGFKKVARSSIDYDYYSKKEMYAAANRRNIENFDDSYFDYRKQIDFDQNELKYYYPYYRFMNRFFENLVCSKLVNQKPIDRNSFEYNYQKIKMIDSVVTSDSLKNSLLRQNAMVYLLNAKNAEEETKYFEIYSKINTDKKNLEEIRKLYEASIKLTAGNQIPSLALVNTDNVVKELQEIINAPTVIYFWTGHSAALYKNIHSRAAELKSKYPEYDFIAINTDTHFKNWRETVRKLNYNKETEYQLENLADAEKKLVLNAMSKVIIVDKNGIILEGKTNMFNSNFEELLLGFLNR